MKIAEDERLSIIDDATLALGQILLRHRELSENLLDTQQTERGMERIDALRKQIDDERERLAAIRHVQQRKRELDRIRKANEKESRGTQTEQKSGMASLLKQQ